MIKNKAYLRPDTPLAVGDYLLERNRFNPNDYVILKVTNYQPDIDSMHVVRVFGTDRIYNSKHNIYCQISAHTTQRNTARLTYKLEPNHPYVLFYEQES